MYQLNESEIQHEHRHEPPREPAGEGSSAHRNGAGRSDARLRVVRVPGGFAYVEEELATSEA